MPIPDHKMTQEEMFELSRRALRYWCLNPTSYYARTVELEDTLYATYSARIMYANLQIYYDAELIYQHYDLREGRTPPRIEVIDPERTIELLHQLRERQVLDDLANS